MFYMKMMQSMAYERAMDVDWSQGGVVRMSNACKELSTGIS